MKEIEEYQTEINNIFSVIAKLKVAFKENDNENMINNLEEYKEDAVELIKGLSVQK